MATNQLALYNIAIQSIGQRTLDSTSEKRPERRALDKVWDRAAGAVEYFLEQGLWDHAMERSLLAPTTTPEFGYTYGYTVPTDLVRLAQISADADFADPLLRYEIEGSDLLAEATAVYVRYVSNSTTKGNDLSLWPETFTLWAGHWLGTQIAPGFVDPQIIPALEQRTEALLTNARAKDASQGQRPWPPRDYNTLEHRELDHPLSYTGPAEGTPRRRG